MRLNGTARVIVPFEGGGIDVFSSSNGGVSWGKSQAIAGIQSHFVAAGLRNPTQFLCKHRWSG